ncbi:hypothetical protein [Streptomyces sp. NBC_01320]|uniref:hypothetical protein n=1 Tax=Streptomyces sp. NBC_01320 TaxID=2903824 RepID=UPI002E0E8AD0|nr:hypothetical protein OG395_45435 [Streptomyces sp. NBC_01320]
MRAAEGFGRTWTRGSDRIETRGISEVIDSHDLLAGIFDGEQNRLVVQALT